MTAAVTGLAEIAAASAGRAVSGENGVANAVALVGSVARARWVIARHAHHWEIADRVLKARRKVIVLHARRWVIVPRVRRAPHERRARNRRRHRLLLCQPRAARLLNLPSRRRHAQRKSLGADE